MYRSCCNLWCALALVSLGGCSSGKDYSQTLTVHFNPMYSGWDGVHMYQIPATVDNASAVHWAASDDAYVDLTPDPNGVDVMITTKKPGNVTIIATTNDAIGKVPLTIEPFSPDLWQTGMTRYVSGAQVTIGGGVHGQGGKDVACTSCHGSSAIEHTPEQTGGFTDDQLKNIFLHGMLPASDAANPFFGGAQNFMSFHTWDVADDNEANGLVAYLRSLKPMAQGQIDFGGRGGDGGVHGPRDGGFGGGGDGGFGGGGGATDAGVPGGDM